MIALVRVQGLHLDQRQTRELIADELRDDPERSNRQIGDALGVDKNTVNAVRSELETTGQIHQLTATTGKDRKARLAYAPVREAAKERQGKRPPIL